MDQKGGRQLKEGENGDPEKKFYRSPNQPLSLTEVGGRRRE